MTPEYSPVVRRRQLGARLRQLREAAGRTLDEAAAHLDCSVAKVSRIETARVPVRAPDVRSLLDLYQATEADRAAVLSMVQASRRRPWWRQYADLLPEGLDTFLGLEDDAREIRWYEPFVVPGLLQTREYAYAVAAPRTDVADERVDRLVEVRMATQRVLTRDSPPRLHAIVDEAALHRVIGSAATMRAQLTRLTELRATSTVIFQVVPFSAGMTAAGNAAFVIFGFADPDVPDVVYTEHLWENRFEDRVDRVARYSWVFDDLVSSALTPADSLALVAEVAAGHR